MTPEEAAKEWLRVMLTEAQWTADVIPNENNLRSGYFFVYTGDGNFWDGQTWTRDEERTKHYTGADAHEAARRTVWHLLRLGQSCGVGWRQDGPNG